MPLLDTRRRIVKRPLLRLKLLGKDGDQFEAFALVDSGADTTTLNIQYADALGISLERANPKQINGIGNEQVDAHVGMFPFEIPDMGIKLEVPAWYVDSKNVDILLGQEVFFENFKIRFEKDHNAFEITPSKK
ncbi:MAG: hypothetical protein UY64_C0022G0014 [Parcubacteria group bacterium GW2011_GWA1_51_12]|nr:MAG: hypothetical protein UY64_C0022G0014 [Parcubacteria group bacterium GW2011_GWA1_51_12]